LPTRFDCEKRLSNDINVKAARISNLVQQNELLNSFAGVDLSSIEIALRVGNYLMQPVKLAGVAAIVSRLAHDSAICASQCPDHIVPAVSDKQVFLILVR
jgi:hypothetical protein